MEFDYTNDTSHYNFTDSSDDYDSYDFRVTYDKAVRGFLGVVGLLADALLLGLFATTPSQRTVTNMFLLQRAVADAVFQIVVLVTMAPLEDLTICRTVSFMVHVNGVAGIIMLCLFSLESYMASCPQQHTLSFRYKAMLGTSISVWLLAALVGVVAYFLTETVDQICMIRPFFGGTFNMEKRVIELFLMFLVPLVVTWTMVSMALPPRRVKPSGAPNTGGQEGPNRRLLLALASAFTVADGLYWLASFLSDIGGVVNNGLLYVFVFLTDRYLSPVLVIWLTEELRQKVFGWLPGRRSASLPLQDL